MFGVTERAVGRGKQTLDECDRWILAHNSRELASQRSGVRFLVPRKTCAHDPCIVIVRCDHRGQTVFA